MICHLSTSISECLRGTTLISNIALTKWMREKILKMVMLLNRFFIKMVMGRIGWFMWDLPSNKNHFDFLHDDFRAIYFNKKSADNFNIFSYGLIFIHSNGICQLLDHIVKMLRQSYARVDVCMKDNPKWCFIKKQL